MPRLLVLCLAFGAFLPVRAQDPTAPGPHETVTVSGSGGERQNAEQPDLSAAEREIVERTNAFREKQGREPVQVDETLTKAAEEFAQYMARTGRYGHQADGRTPAERVAAAGYEYCTVRENIAYAFRSDGFSAEQLAERFFTGWKESPGHRRNMLAKEVTETGVAIAKSQETGTYFAVQLFARPKSKSFTFEVVNRSELTVTYRVGERTFPLSPRVVRTHTQCQPATVRFLPVGSDAEGSEPASPVERIRVESDQRLAVVPADEGYRVEVEQAPDGER